MTAHPQRAIVEALEQAEKALSRLRALLSGEAQDAESPDVLYARRMLSVLAEVERRGGRVRTDELLDIGEGFGYRRRGMAGFYQDLVRREGDEAVLTDEGHARLAQLRKRYDRLSPPPVSHPFWEQAFPEDPMSDPFIQWLLRKDKPSSGKPFRAEDAKRELYRTWS
jgi:hypothetical protein